MLALYLACLSPAAAHESRYWQASHSKDKPKPSSSSSVGFAALPPKNSSNAWDSFYKLHNDAFFKDRHYFSKEHVGLCSALTSGGGKKRLRILDFGCGVGNSIIPLLESSSSNEGGVCVDYLGLDISPHAVGILQQRLAHFSADNRHHFQCFALDLTDAAGWDACISKFAASLVDEEPFSGFDYCLMIFTLSALHPRDMDAAVARVSRVMRPGGGGTVCFRDYCVGDMAMERFSAAQRVGRHLYLRQDGTLSFFFTAAGLISLFEEQHMRCTWTKALNRTIENRAKHTQMKRSWLGAEFVRI